MLSLNAHIHVLFIYFSLGALCEVLGTHSFHRDQADRPLALMELAVQLAVLWVPVKIAEKWNSLSTCMKPAGHFR